jgi:hypothetical protein
VRERRVRWRWWKRKPTRPVPADLEHARAVKEEAVVEYGHVLREGFATTRLAAAIANSRRDDPYGDDLAATFTRKG